MFSLATNVPMAAVVIIVQASNLFSTAQTVCRVVFAIFCEVLGLGESHVQGLQLRMYAECTTLRHIVWVLVKYLAEIKI